MNTPVQRSDASIALCDELSMRARLAQLPTFARSNLVVLAVAAVALVVALNPYWRENPDLTHGFLMPVVFLFLLHESRKGSPRYLAGGGGTIAMFALLAVAGLTSLCATGLYAAALAWSHSLVAFTGTSSLILFLLAGLVVFSTKTTRLVPFNWTSFSAIVLWLLCAPIPPGSYTRLTLGLQLAVTESVLGTLHLLGIAANRHGNIIDLATTSVGVEEACTGIRSLIACVFTGWLFSATLVHRTWPRVLLLASAAPLAIAMNFARSLTLTLLANGGVDILGRWHDLTGFAVLGVTAALLFWCASKLNDGRGLTSARKYSDEPKVSLSDRSRLQIPLLGTLVFAAALATFFALNTRPSIRGTAPVPNLAKLLPEKIEGWRVETATDLYQFSKTLQTDHLAQRTYLRTIDNHVEQVTLYLAYWRAGQAPASLVASHTPDACWPGSGWVPAPLPAPRETLAIANRPLAPAESRKFVNDDYPQYVWFWHVYDGHPITYRDPYSPAALLKLALRYGFTHDGDQLFVRVSSNRPWSALAMEPLLDEFFRNLRPLGL